MFFFAVYSCWQVSWLVLRTYVRNSVCLLELRRSLEERGGSAWPMPGPASLTPNCCALRTFLSTVLRALKLSFEESGTLTCFLAMFLKRSLARRMSVLLRAIKMSTNSVTKCKDSVLCSWLKLKGLLYLFLESSSV